MSIGTGEDAETEAIEVMEETRLCDAPCGVHLHTLLAKGKICRHLATPTACAQGRKRCDPVSSLFVLKSIN